MRDDYGLESRYPPTLRLLLQSVSLSELDHITSLFLDLLSPIGAGGLTLEQTPLTFTSTHRQESSNLIPVEVPYHSPRITCAVAIYHGPQKDKLARPVRLTMCRFNKTTHCPNIDPNFLN